MTETNIGTDSPLAHKVISAGEAGKGKYAPKVSKNLKGRSRFAGERPRDEKGRLTKRRYGPTSRKEEEDEAIVDTRPFVLADMDDNEVKTLALRQFGRRFHDEETPQHIRNETQRIIDAERYGRYA